MAKQREYDAIVIGAGQAGGPLATAFARAGRKTALIEREHVGGTCINEGCTPTKTMVASARVAYLARRGADYGVETGPISVDLAKVRERKRNIVKSFREGSERRIIETQGLDLLYGEARFTGPKTLDVKLNDGGETLSLRADTIVINTGERPSMPDVPGLDSVPTLNSTTIMELDSVPAHLIVLGGSYVGLEFAQMFRRFGSRVTIVQRGGQLLSREDPDIAEAVAAILREDGIELLLRTKLARASMAPAGEVAITVATPEGERTLGGSHVLVALGRTPNTDDLNLTAAGVATDDKGYIPVNAKLETNAPGIYAARGCTRRPGLHAYLLRRLPYPQGESARGRHGYHDRAPGPLHRLHRPATGARRLERGRREGSRPQLPRGEDADERCGPRARGG